jgi:hypothetical protein
MFIAGDTYSVTSNDSKSPQATINNAIVISSVRSVKPTDLNINSFLWIPGTQWSMILSLGKDWRVLEYKIPGIMHFTWNPAGLLAIGIGTSFCEFRSLDRLGGFDDTIEVSASKSSLRAITSGEDISAIIYSRARRGYGLEDSLPIADDDSIVAAWRFLKGIFDLLYNRRH